MENPWLSYDPAQNAPKFHELDEAHVKEFNMAMHEPNYKLAEHLEPFPFTGNQKANVLVLLANPGISEIQTDVSFRIHPEYAKQNLRCLRHQNAETYIEWIYSQDNPERESDWLIPRIRYLVKDTSINKVSRGLFLMNYHAYNSVSWYPIPFTFETQRYSFQLVSDAMKRNALIIMRRNELGWFTAIPGLSKYKNRVSFKSSRSVHISRPNLGDEAYEELLKRLESF